MKIDYKTIGQRCTATTKEGKQCRLPAHTIAGGLAVCPYHINQAVRLFRKVSSRSENKEHKDIFNKARDDSTIY